MTINEALEMDTLLRNRISELNVLRSNNAVKESWRSGKDVIEVKEPLYDVKKVDKLILRLSKELRLLKSAVKKTNATVDVKGYEGTTIESVDLGELEDIDI